jgi:hypothetical protein
MALVKPLHSGDPDMMLNSHAATCIRSDLHAYSTRDRITFNHDPHRDLRGGAVAAQVRSEWQLIMAVRMDLFIECLPAVAGKHFMQEVLCRRSRVRFPAEKQHSQMLYAKDVDGSGQASTNK